MKKTMLLLAIAGLFLVSGCSKEEKSLSPKETTALFLDGIQNRDSDAVEKVSEWEDFNIKALEMQEDDYIDGVDHDLQKTAFEKMMYFEHQEMKETTTENTAVVTVEFQQYDISKSLEEGIKKAEEKVTELSQKDMSDAEIENAISTILFESLGAAEDKKYTTIDIQLVKREDAWMISDDNEQLQELLSANLNVLRDQ